MERPSFIGNYKDLQEPDNSHYQGSTELLSVGAPIGRSWVSKQLVFILKRFPQAEGPHGLTLKVRRRSLRT